MDTHKPNVSYLHSLFAALLDAESKRQVLKIAEKEWAEKPDAQPVAVRQYPLRLEARQGLAPLILLFLDAGILVPVQSSWCTPILPVQKPNGTWCFVQDLREVNRHIRPLHPVVANPYTLLTTLQSSQTWYTCVDLKDAYFTVGLAPKLFPIFCFEWQDPPPTNGGRHVLAWTRLPMGCRNSSTVFAAALIEDLSHLETPGCTLISYVDDILLASDSMDALRSSSIALLNHLAACGYKISREKVLDALPPQPDQPPCAEVETWVLIKELCPSPEQPRWSLPKQVLLSTPTAVKVEGIKPWIHCSRVKSVPDPNLSSSLFVVKDDVAANHVQRLAVKKPVTKISTVLERKGNKTLRAGTGGVAQKVLAFRELALGTGAWQDARILRSQLWHRLDRIAFRTRMNGVRPSRGCVSPSGGPARPCSTLSLGGW
uniref:uncharacterized protein LOC130494072 n=1 Tax=Euleptes europaea TaxID=460621 RepID=UPI00253FE58F|nr:uncharacterized protein LOC130494072 [Euleptes europaea]